jgi:hypothetical protein
LAALREINRVYAAVSFTVTVADDARCKKIETCRERHYGERYSCRVPNAARLENIFHEGRN